MTYEYLLKLITILVYIFFSPKYAIQVLEEETQQLYLIDYTRYYNFYTA